MQVWGGERMGASRRAALGLQRTLCCDCDCDCDCAVTVTVL